MFTIIKLPQVRSSLPSRYFAGAIAICVSPLTMATDVLAVPLTFDTLVGGTESQSVLGPVATRETLLFTDVATENGFTIDARVTATVIGDTHFGSISDPNASNMFGSAGFLPDYHGSVGGPEQDLGFLYYGNGINENANGLSILFEFFDGTGAMTGSFTDARTLSEVQLAIYDVDGEGFQSEYFTAFKSDGLVSYAVGTSASSLVATQGTDEILFEGPNTNFSELDATGAALLTYEDTNALTLEFGSVQNSGPYQNGVFSAIDGDVSLFDQSDFSDPVTVNAVPVPQGALLLLSAAFLLLVRGARSSNTSKDVHSKMTTLMGVGP